MSFYSFTHPPDVSYRLAILLLGVKHGLKHRAILCLILFVLIILLHIFINRIHHHIRSLLIVLNQLTELIQTLVNLL